MSTPGCETQAKKHDGALAPAGLSESENVTAKIDRRGVVIGIPVRHTLDGLPHTLASLSANTPPAIRLVILADGITVPEGDKSRQMGAVLEVGAQTPLGHAAAFNRFVADVDADVFVLLENGARVGPDWLEMLLAALSADPSHGLAGPSTNLCWNEQRAIPSVGGSPEEIATTAQRARDQFREATAYLEPLHSLGDFCYAVKREVIEAVGAADEAYGLGPCWEMDYNIRAARAGFRGVWAKAAFVWRAPLTPKVEAQQTRLFEAAKHRYQDRFCGLRLSGQKHGYDAHCTGDACEHFAPRDKIQIHLPLKRREDSTSMTQTPLAASQSVTASSPLLSSGTPLVSCLMPTSNRRAYVAAAIADFLRQDYEPKELVILDDGTDPIADLVPSDPRVRYIREARKLSLGAKRNLCCSHARGDIFVHWDDDDWHAPWRVSYQVAELLRLDLDLCGLSELLFYDPTRSRAWRYRYPRSAPPWVAGGTFCFRRTLWERQRFADITIGEDTRYVNNAGTARVAALERHDFYVARVHAGNTSHKHTSGCSWQPIDVAQVRRLIDDRPARPVESPCHELVSCIMPTADRRPFIALALAGFASQTYPNRELIVVDDGADAVGDLMPSDESVRYIRLPHRHSIGAKRNIACAEARGRVLIGWDDDDWYSPRRLSLQVEPILSGRAELTGLEGCWVMSLPAGEVWTISPDLNRRMFFADVAGGTVAFEKSVWSRTAYPDGNLGEDAAFLRVALNYGSRLERLGSDGVFVYTRHGRNAWVFQTGQFLDSGGWTRARQPSWLPDHTLAAYQEAARRSIGRHAVAG